MILEQAPYTVIKVPPTQRKELELSETQDGLGDGGREQMLSRHPSWLRTG